MACTDEKKKDKRKFSQAMDYFKMNIPKFTEDMGVDEKAKATRAAVNIITSLGLLESSQNIEKRNFNIKAKYLYEAILFLTKNNAVNALKTFTLLLKHNSGDHSSISLTLGLCTLEVCVLDIDAFRALVITSLNYIPGKIKQNEEYQTSYMLDVFKLVFEFITPRSPYCVFIARTANILMRTHLMNVSFDNYEERLHLIANTFVIICHYTKAVEYLERISKLLVKRWTVDKRNSVWNHYYNCGTWNSHDCMIVCCLIDVQPRQPNFLSKWTNLIPRVSLMLTQKNISKGALKVLETILGHIDVEEWNLTFVPFLTKSMPNKLQELRSYVKSILLECVKLAIQRFGESVYIRANNSEVDKVYTSIALFCCINTGLLSIKDYKTDIISMLFSTIIVAEEYMIKILCRFNQKGTLITTWQLPALIIYLDCYLFQTDIDCMEDLHFLLSHICVTANKMISDLSIFKDNIAGVMLIEYAQFISDIYDYCTMNIKSKSPQRVAFAAKLFSLIHDIFTKGEFILKTKYKITNAKYLDQTCLNFAKFLETKDMWKFGSLNAWKSVLNTFLDHKILHHDLEEVVMKLCLTDIEKDKSDFDRIFEMGMDLLTTRYDYESVEKGCSCILILLTNNMYSDEILSIVNTRLLNKKMHLANRHQLFKALTNSPLFGLTKCLYYLLNFKFIQVGDNFFTNRAFDHCENTIRALLDLCYYCYDGNLFSCAIKVIEHTLIACLDIMKIISIGLAKVNGKWFVTTLRMANMLMKKGNMKKSVVAAAKSIRDLCSIVQTLESNEQQVLVIKFLEYVLYSIYVAPEYLTSKIRRSPEHRLTIHAIVVADQRPTHPFLRRAMEFLLGVLSDPDSASGSIASALHTVEILVSDNSIRNSMLPFISPIAVHCINGFSSNDWQIKNAAIQVLQSFVSCVLGQKTNVLHRRNAIEDVFILFPQLAIYFYTKLENSNIQNVCDSAIAILAVFSESHRKSSIFLSTNINFILRSFLIFFSNFICTNASVIGIFAAKAFAAMYSHIYIPFIICDIIEWLRLNFCNASKNVFYTTMCLLQALYERFNVFCYVSHYKIGLSIIQSAFHDLAIFLERFNEVYKYSLFSLLNIKSNTPSAIEKSLLCQLNEPEYQSRLWLHNNIPYLLNHSDIEQFDRLLKLCLNTALSMSLQLKCLNAVLNRYNEIVTCSHTSEVLTVVLNKFFELTSSCEYLTVGYSHVIFLLVEVDNFIVNLEFLTRLRSQYKKVDKTSIYSVSVFVTLLSQIDTFTVADQTFIKDAIGTYKTATAIDDFEVQLHVSSTLKYLYKCAEVSDRHHLLKLAFILLLNEETSLEIRKFVAVAFEVKFSNIYLTLQNLLSFKNLTNQLGSTVNAGTFLIDMTVFVTSLKDSFEDAGKFYLKQNNDLCLHKHYLTKFLLNKIKTVFKDMPRNTCIAMLLNATNMLNNE